MSRGGLVVTATESALVVLGLAFVVSSSAHAVGTVLLLVWDVLACLYVAVGAVVVRRAGHGAAPTGYWFNLAFTVAASLIGMAAAARAILGEASDLLGVGAMILSWLLLHAGFARLYHARFADALDFPGQPDPGHVDFLYFSYTIAVSFAVSDVSLTRSDVRWQVTVHSVISFFYNAAVIALAIETITG